MEDSPEKSPPAPAAALAIDGARIRGIREARKLTQLYVASVVGVTTDTISRWENNRYPSIKRDNAEKLADALEVRLEDILRQDAQLTLSDESVPEQEPATTPPKQKVTPVILVAVFLGLAAVLALVLVRQQTAAPAAIRTLPPFAAPGSIIPVQIAIERSSAPDRGYILKEQLPPGWRLVSASPPVPAAATPSGEPKWILPATEGRHIVSYTVQVPDNAPLNGNTAFSGNLVASSGENAVGGNRSLTTSGRHWADRNGDGRIDDNEIMPAYYLCEEMKGLGLDWKAIEEIWNGKGYRWIPATRSFSVIR